MNIGQRVKSRIYADKGAAVILNIEELFDSTYFELLFKNGERITTSEDDLVLLSDPISLLKVGNLSSPLEFYTKLMDSRLEANLTENTLISSTNYKIQPLPHQLLTVNFVINRFQPRCLIADEVGLGKTIEAILVYEEYKLRGMVNRAIIIVPSGLVLQWQEELLSKFNENFIIFSKEYIRTLKQSYGEETNVWKLHNKILVSIDSIKPYRITKDLDPIEKQRREWHNKNIFEDIVSADFDIAIFDEAHRLTKKSDGSETSRFKLGKELSEAIPIFLLLTATPHQGDEDLFIHLMRLIDPVMFGDKDMLTPELVQEVSVRNKKRAVVDFEGNLIFKHRITSIIEINRDAEANKDELELYQLITEYTEHYYNLAKKGNNQLMMLLVMLYQRINSSSSFAVLDTLKRRKQFLQGTNEKFEGVLTDLDFEVEDQEIILKTITESKKDLEKELFFIDQCILIAEKLTLTYTDKKFESLITIIEEITKREKNPSLKFIVFTEFRATQDALIQYLDNFGYSSAFINGSLSREERKEQIEDFRKHKQFLISTDAGGEGINLQFCSCIINFDLPWNPSRLEQRIGRIDRIGQDKNVLIFNFHLKDSVEDRVRSILEEKLNLIKEQFGEDKFTDIISLLQDEFSFERIYADALQIKEKESKKLIKQAEQIYQRAQEIIESEDLLIPFTANEQNPNELLNSDSNKIIKSLVISYLKSNEIEIHRYKENKELCFFDNPFHTRKNNIHTYRNVTFENSETYKAGQVEFINVEHPLLSGIRRDIQQKPDYGSSCALRLKLNKFTDNKGYWFIFKLTIKNNVDKVQISTISIFMEDADFCNNRISNYLNGTILDEVEVYQNFQADENLHQIVQNAFAEAKARASETYLAIKIDWMGDIEKYEQRAEAYFQYRERTLNNVLVDNIRESRRKKNQEQRSLELAALERKKMIVPKIELVQTAYVEFI